MHINNVALTQILEDARVRFNHSAGLFGTLHDAGFRAMVASLAVDYLGEGLYPDPLHVHVAPLHFGRTSYTLGQVVVQRGTPIAFARAVLVCVGPDGPAEVPASFRDGAASFMLRE